MIMIEVSGGPCRGSDGGVVGFDAEAVDEGSVDFEDVDGELLEVAKR